MGNIPVKPQIGVLHFHRPGTVSVRQVFGGIETDMNHITHSALTKFLIDDGCNGQILGIGIPPGS